MKEACRHYREQLLDQLDQQWSPGDIPLDRHAEDCAECSRFYREMTDLAEHRAFSDREGIHEPNYHQMRAGVWEAIRAKEDSSIVGHIFRPAIAIPAMIVVLAVSLYFGIAGFESSASSDTGGFLTMEETESVEEDVELSDEEISMLLELELRAPVSEYLLEQQEYSTLEEIYSEDRTWDKVLDELIAAKI